MPQNKERDEVNLRWFQLMIVTFISIYLFVFNEWIFFITKPSFFSVLPLIESIKIYFVTSGIFFILFLIVILVLFSVGKLTRNVKLLYIFLKVGIGIPAFVIASLFLALVDNFTYTIMSFSSVTSQGITRAIYAILFLLIFISQYHKISEFSYKDLESAIVTNKQKTYFAIFSILIIVSIVLPVKINDYQKTALGLEIGNNSDSYPNIIFLTSDGVDANHMSAYGYERETTPFIDSLVDSSLFAENAFTNSGNTTGSLTSMITSKYPTQTHLLYPPDILREEDAFQHLPAILKSIGYYNVQFTVERYGDAFELNIQDGFDYVNGRIFTQIKVLDSIARYYPSEYSYFINGTVSRVFSRLLHILFIKDLANQQKLFLGFPQGSDDFDKINRVVDIIRYQDSPVFSQIHLMGTHGEYFTPSVLYFSTLEGEGQVLPWDNDLYDDSILDFDRAVNMLFDQLSEVGELNQTIIVICTDHGQKWTVTQRLPLIIHFPNDEHARRITSSAEYLDLTPTILDYLNIQQPAWMEGHSFLDEDPDTRPIFGVVGGDAMLEEGRNYKYIYAPPFYNFKFLNVIYCDQWFEINLSNNGWKTGKVLDHTAPCSDEVNVTNGQAFSWMVGHLKEEGFNTETLRLNEN